MAANIFSVAPVSKIACYSDGQYKTVLQVRAPSDRSISVLGWSISFDGISVTADPVSVDIVRQTDSGSMISTTVAKLQNYDETLQSLALYDASVEPATTDILEVYEVHPQSGYEEKYEQKNRIILAKDERLAIRVKANASVNCRVKFICEE